MQIPHDQIVQLIIGDSDFAGYLEQTYSHEWGFFARFREINGPNCPICRASIRYMYVEDKNQIDEAIKIGRWHG